jgi:predicted Zn-dependent protease
MKGRSDPADAHAEHCGQEGGAEGPGSGAAVGSAPPSAATIPSKAPVHPSDIEDERASTPAPAPKGREVVRQIMLDELAAMIAMGEGREDEAISLLTRAADMEKGMRPPSGPPEPVKPAHELLGEALLEAGRPDEAAAAFEISLLRTPNRPRSLMGAARAYAAAGNDALAEARYATLMSFWKGPVPAMPPGSAR